MRVCTLGGLGGGFGAVAMPIPPSPQPYFSASESTNLFTQTVPPGAWGMKGLRGVRGAGRLAGLSETLADVPMPVKHVALGLTAFALGYWIRGRAKKR